MLQGVLKAVSRLPLRWIHALGAVIGWGIYLLSPSYAARLRENLVRSGLCANRRSCRKLLRENVAEAGKSVMELAAVWLRPEEETLRLMRAVHGWDHVEAALARGRGIIFLTPHMGCFEITSLYYAARHPITVLYRPPRLKGLQPLMEAGRIRGRVTLAPTDMGGVRMLLRALKRGEAVGILPDQVPGMGEGVWAEFFGRPAYTMTLAPRLAKATGASVILAWAERLPAGRGFTLWLEPMPFGLDGEAAEAARNLNRGVEALVRRKPAQYLWSYNRYKIPRGAEPPGPAERSPSPATNG
jgi:KDO2-lipid IV(A) lauroyltransferase